MKSQNKKSKADNRTPKIIQLSPEPVLNGLTFKT